MCLLLETDSLENVTPATVSRCGLVYLHKSETCDPKSLFNKWLRSLPPNIAEYAKELDAVANYFMVEALAVYEEEREAGRLFSSKVNLHWLMENFVRLLSTMIYDFYIEFERSQTSSSGNSSGGHDLGKSIMALTLCNKWVDTSGDDGMQLEDEKEPD